MINHRAAAQHHHLLSLLQFIPLAFIAYCPFQSEFV